MKKYFKISKLKNYRSNPLFVLLFFVFSIQYTQAFSQSDQRLVIEKSPLGQARWLSHQGLAGLTVREHSKPAELSQDLHLLFLPFDGGNLREIIAMLSFESYRSHGVKFTKDDFPSDWSTFVVSAFQEESPSLTPVTVLFFRLFMSSKVPSNIQETGWNPERSSVTIKDLGPYNQTLDKDFRSFEFFIGTPTNKKEHKFLNSEWISVMPRENWQDDWADSLVLRFELLDQDQHPYFVYLYFSSSVYQPGSHLPEIVSQDRDGTELSTKGFRIQTPSILRALSRPDAPALDAIWTVQNSSLRGGSQNIRGDWQSSFNDLIPKTLNLRGKSGLKNKEQTLKDTARFISQQDTMCIEKGLSLGKLYEYHQLEIYTAYLSLPNDYTVKTLGAYDQYEDRSISAGISLPSYENAWDGRVRYFPHHHAYVLNLQDVEKKELQCGPQANYAAPGKYRVVNEWDRFKKLIQDSRSSKTRIRYVIDSTQAESDLSCIINDDTLSDSSDLMITSDIEPLGGDVLSETEISEVALLPNANSKAQNETLTETVISEELHQANTITTHINEDKEDKEDDLILSWSNIQKVEDTIEDSTFLDKDREVPPAKNRYQTEIEIPISEVENSSYIEDEIKDKSKNQKNLSPNFYHNSWKPILAASAFTMAVFGVFSRFFKKRTLEKNSFINRLFFKNLKL